MFYNRADRASKDPVEGKLAVKRSRVMSLLAIGCLLLVACGKEGEDSIAIYMECQVAGPSRVADQEGRNLSLLISPTSPLGGLAVASSNGRTVDLDDCWYDIQGVRIASSQSDDDGLQGPPSGPPARIPSGYRRGPEAIIRCSGSPRLWSGLSTGAAPAGKRVGEGFQSDFDFYYSESRSDRALRVSFYSVEPNYQLVFEYTKCEIKGRLAAELRQLQ